MSVEIPAQLGPEVVVVPLISVYQNDLDPHDEKFFKQISDEKRPAIQWREEVFDVSQDVSHTLNETKRWAILLGPSNLVCIDLDRHGSLDGVEQWRAFLKQNELPEDFETFTTESVNGGLHIYFEVEPGFNPFGSGKKVGIIEGVDLLFGWNLASGAPFKSHRKADGKLVESGITNAAPVMKLPDALLQAFMRVHAEAVAAQEVEAECLRENARLQREQILKNLGENATEGEISEAFIQAKISESAGQLTSLVGQKSRRHQEINRVVFSAGLALGPEVCDRYVASIEGAAVASGHICDCTTSRSLAKAYLQGAASHTKPVVSRNHLSLVSSNSAVEEEVSMLMPYSLTTDEIATYLAPKLVGRWTVLSTLKEATTRFYEPTSGLWELDLRDGGLDCVLASELRDLRDLYLEEVSKAKKSGSGADEKFWADGLSKVKSLMDKRRRQSLRDTLNNRDAAYLPLHSDPVKFSDNPDGMALAGGKFFHYLTGEVRDLTPEDRFTTSVNLDYCPGKGKNDPRLKQLFATVPADSRKNAIEALALATLKRSVKEGFFWVGPTNSGKTKIGQLHKNVFSGFSKDVSEDTFSMRNKKPLVDKNAVFVGPRGIFVEELPEDGQLDEHHFKSVIGANSLPARYLFNDEQNYEVYFTLHCFTNHPPRFFDADDATRNRVVIIPTLYSYVDNPQEDYERQKVAAVDDWVKDQDVQEAYLSLILETCHELAKANYERTPYGDSIRLETAKWKEESNPLRADAEYYITKAEDPEMFVEFGDLAEELNSFKADHQKKYTSSGLYSRFKKMPEYASFAVKAQGAGLAKRSTPPSWEGRTERVWSDENGTWKNMPKPLPLLGARAYVLRGWRFMTKDEIANKSLGGSTR